MKKKFLILFECLCLSLAIVSIPFFTFKAIQSIFDINGSQFLVFYLSTVTIWTYLFINGKRPE